MFLCSRWEKNKLWSESWKAFPRFNLLLISSWISFWFITIIPTIWTMPHLRTVYKLSWYNHCARIPRLFSLYSSYCINYSSLALIMYTYTFLIVWQTYWKYSVIYTHEYVNPFTYNMLLCLHSFLVTKDHAMAHAPSCWLLTAEDQVQYQGSPHQMCQIKWHRERISSEYCSFLMWSSFQQYSHFIHLIPMLHIILANDSVIK